MRRAAETYGDEMLSQRNDLAAQIARMPIVNDRKYAKRAVRLAVKPAQSRRAAAS